MRLARISMAALFLIVLISTIACEPASYQLYTYTYGQGVISPSSGTYDDGELLAIAAVPADGWEFDYWSGDATGSENPEYVRVHSDKYISAHFTEIELSTPTPTATQEPTPTATVAFTPEPTVAPTPTPIPTPTPYVAPTVLTTESELQEFLEESCSTCYTSIGTTSFSFDIYENTYITSPYDYWIQVEYNMSFFYDLQYSNDISTEMNHIVAGELQNCMEALARDVISRTPNTKFWGGYYKSWYRYPNLQVDLITRHYYSWVNYAPPSLLTSYEDAYIAGFAWYDLIDDSLVR